MIKGLLDIKLNEISNNIVLFNSEIKDGIDVYLNNKKINMIKDGKKWEMDYKFENDGKYTFEIVFNDEINNISGLFEKCANIISLDLSNFYQKNIINTRLMFNDCNKLKEIKGINKFITNKVTNMGGMFQLCSELEFLDLTNLDTSNVTSMRAMFNKCYKLKEIKGIDKFITTNIINMEVMFQLCNKLSYLDL